MALNTYNAAKHHIGLKVQGGATNYGFMLVGGYDKQLQREGIGAQEFGGSTDLIGMNPSNSRWTQDDFTGGAYQYDWGQDDAMFADCTGMIPSQRARSLITVPPMFLKQAIRVDDDTYYTSGVCVSMFNVSNYIFIAFSHAIYRYNTASGALTGPTNVPTDAANTVIVQANFDPNDGIIYVLCNRTGGSNPRPIIHRLDTALAAATQASYDSPTALNSTGTTFRAKGFQICDSYILAGLGQRLYYIDPPENTNTAGLNAVWTRAGRLPGYWVDSIPYNGMTYILTAGFQSQTHIVAYDGSAVLPIVTFPFNFEGKSIIEYGGRVFVGGIGSDVNGDEQYAELYEVTGSSVRLVKTFMPETNRTGSPTWPKSVVTLTVYEGMLWWCQKGVRLMAYDLTTDGIFGASELQGVSDGQMWGCIPGKGRLWGWVNSPANPTTKSGIYKIAGGSDSVSSYTPEMVTSDFSYEPALKKRWSEIHVLTRYGAAAMDYSLDGGNSWTALTVSTTSSGVMYHNVASLAGVALSEHIRFKLKFPKSTTVSDFIELVAFTVAFQFLDTGKKAWSFVINGADEIEGRDELSVTQDVGLTATTLWGWAENKDKLTFTDVDDATYDVQVQGFSEHQPLIGPDITGTTTRMEAQYAITLTQV